MNKKLKTFALVMALVMALSSIAFAAADFTSRYGTAALRKGCGDPDGSSPKLQIYVEHLQADLTSLGFNCGLADGIFGSKTERAVKNFLPGFIF